MRGSLFWRLMGAFAVVILVGVVVVTLIAKQTTAREFQQYMFRGQMMRLSDIAAELSAYYRAQGNWSDVSAMLRRASGGMMGDMDGMMGGMMGNSAGASGLWLAAPNGVIFASPDGSRLGARARNLSISGASSSARSPARRSVRTVSSTGK